MQISVVIPTCNRKARLLGLLQSLDRSSYRPLELIIVDSGEDRLSPADYAGFTNLAICYMGSKKSVCIQRNTGIQKARAPWIFLCDDDMEVPPDYLRALSAHVEAHPETGAVSGLFLQQEKTGWTAQYPLHSAKELLWKFIFQLGIWGAIDCPANGWPFRSIKNYYRRRGNHISKAGWPVITDFSGPWFVTPVYSLGASLVRKEWLLQSPFDELLDRHGMGDNYGVAAGFPAGIHILTDAFVYHHREPANRLQRPLQYFRRVMALDYFMSGKARRWPGKKRWLLWSLAGNLPGFILVGEGSMIKASLKAIALIATGRNPYRAAAKSKAQP